MRQTYSRIDYGQKANYKALGELLQLTVYGALFLIDLAAIGAVLSALLGH